MKSAGSIPCEPILLRLFANYSSTNHGNRNSNKRTRGRINHPSKSDRIVFVWKKLIFFFMKITGYCYAHTAFRLLVPKIIFTLYASSRTYQAEKVPNAKVGIVFGGWFIERWNAHRGVAGPGQNWSRTL
jgi:hypothetical protein